MKQSTRREFTAAFLPLGDDTPPTRSMIRRATRCLGSLGVKVAGAPCVVGEVAVVRSTEALLASTPDCLVIYHTRGGSARAAVLAARTADLPTVLWSHDENHSLPSSALAAGTLRDLGNPVQLIHGRMASASFRKELGAAAAAAGSVGKLRRARIGVVGPAHPNLTSVNTDSWRILDRLGAWVTPITLARVHDAAKSLTPGRLRRQAITLDKLADLSRMERDTMDAAVRLDLALCDIARQEELDALALDCWNTILPHFLVTPCLLFLHERPVLACEGDPVLAASLLAGEWLAGGAYGGDVYSINEETGVLMSRHCGASRSFSGSTRVTVSEGAPPALTAQVGQAISVHARFRKGAATLFLICGEDLGTLQLASGGFCGGDHDGGVNVKVKLACDPSEFRRHLRGNHYVILPGDHRRELAMLGHYLGMRVHEFPAR